MTLSVAAAQPVCVAKDVVANAHAHADAIRAADARVVVFPELSLTGYELDADVVAPDDPALSPIVEACAACDAVALVGAPVAGDYIAMLRVDGDGVSVAYRKTHVYGSEPQRFLPGDGAVAIEVDGWRLGLAICKDTGVEEHVRSVAALDVDVYVAGVVHLHSELAEQDRRGLFIAATCDAYVVLASHAGPTGGGFDDTAGTSTIWAPDGSVLARAGEAPGEVVRAQLG